jgi:hypothetical protein
VTSGYCPRYRYTLIATLTLANLYYICVDFLPTHTIGESVLPAHFLRVIRRSFQFVGLFMWIDSFHVGRAGIHSLAFFVSCGSFFARVFPLGHSLVPRFVGVIRWVIFVFVGSFVGHSWESFVGSLRFFVGLFRCVGVFIFSREFSCGLFVRDSK